MSLFKVSNYADEFRNALEGKAAPLPVPKDESVARVAEDIEETTRDFILKTSSRIKRPPICGIYCSSTQSNGLPYASIRRRTGCRY